MTDQGERPTSDTASGSAEGLAGGELPGEGIDTTLGDKATGGEAAWEALGPDVAPTGGGTVADEGESLLDKAKDLLHQAKEKAADLMGKAKDKTPPEG